MTVTPIRPIFTGHEFDHRGQLVRINIASRTRAGVSYQMGRYGNGWMHMHVGCPSGGPCWHTKILDEYEAEFPAEVLGQGTPSLEFER